MKKIVYITLATLLLSLTSCRYEKVNLIDQADVIYKDSDLFELITKMTSDTENPIENIACIRFIYSFVVFTYDENFNVISQTFISNNEEFSELLVSVAEGNSISISYPITTTLEDGTPFDITTNEELKQAIDNCKDEELIGECNAIINSNCIWKMPYLDASENAYASALITTYATMQLNYMNRSYIGSWVPLINENQLQLNINFPETDSIAPDWNHNYNVQVLNNDKMILESPDGKIHTFIKHCESDEEFAVGDTTPYEGIVAYDKGSFEDGWQYIETLQTDLLSEEWGCTQADVNQANYNNIGSGWQASVAIANYHNNLDNYFENPEICSSENNGTVTAISALTYTNESMEDYPNWFIPSIEELQLLYDNLHTQGLGSFSNGIYWSSTQVDAELVKALNFETGEIVEIPKNSSNIKTRIIRYF